MKKLIFTVIVIMIATAGAIAYERYFVQSEFGPSSLLGVSLLLFFALALTITLFSFGTRFHEVVTRVWLVGLSVVLTFVVVDLAAGVLLVKPLSPELSPDKIRHHKLVPNTDSRFEQPDFSYIQHVNNLGIRGKDSSFKKLSHHYRVLMLGDSFTMGKGMEDNQTFSALLEVSLNQQRVCESTTFEVLNGGVDSYAPVLSYLQLSGDLAPLEVDLVLLNLDLSDLLQEAAYRKEAVYDSTGEIIGVPGSKRPLLFNQRIRSWIDQHTFFTRLLLFHTNKWLGYQDLTVQGVVTRANPELLKYTLAEDKVNRDEQWAQIFGSIAKIKKLADERSTAFALVIYPWGHQVSETEWLPGRYNFIPEGATASDKYLDTIYQRSKQLGIELVDLFPAFRAYKGDAPLYFKYDMHWTAEGHKVAALALEKYLIESHLATLCESK
ncbi:MAG: hypothetical protein ABL970_07505 [Nitrospira sp.]